MSMSIQSIAVVVAILGGSAVFTEVCARTMYNRCAECGSLNAKRRAECRICGTPIETGVKSSPDQTGG